MIIWAVGGLVAGWLLASRLNVGCLALVLIGGSILPVAVLLPLQALDLTVIVGWCLFLVTIQVGYLAANWRWSWLREAVDDPEAGGRR